MAATRLLDFPAGTPNGMPAVVLKSALQVISLILVQNPGLLLQLCGGDAARQLKLVEVWSQHGNTRSLFELLDATVRAALPS